jgi:hypothetical protein
MRREITEDFPGYANSNGDADGIGSRYFWIQNGGGGQMMVKNNEAGSLDLEKDELPALSQVINIPLNIEDILVSTKFAVNGKKIRYSPDAKGHLRWL